MEFAQLIAGAISTGLAITLLNWLGCIPMCFGRSPLVLPFLSTAGNLVGVFCAPEAWIQAISGAALVLDPVNWAYVCVGKDAFRHSRFTRIRSWSGAAIHLALHDHGDFVLTQTFDPSATSSAVRVLRRGMVGRWSTKDGSLLLSMDAGTAVFSMLGDLVMMTQWFSDDREPAPAAGTMLPPDGKLCWRRARWNNTGGQPT